MGLPKNIQIINLDFKNFRYETVHGDCIFVGFENGDFRSLTAEEVKGIIGDEI